MEGGSNTFLKIFLILAHSVAIYVGIRAARWTPAPLGEDAPVDVFSEGRALQHVRHLAETIGHRQVGSPGLTQAVTYLTGVLEGYKREGQRLHPELDIEVDVQYGTGWTTIFIFDHVMHNAYSGIPNVAMRVAPRAPNATSQGAQVPGVLVNSHFDSTLGTGGASDATSLIGIMLELARLMTCTHALKVASPVVFLFNGAEETLLQGGHAWYSAHPWAADLRAVINLESTGPGGPDLLFQVKGEWAVDAYARAAKYPHGSVTAQDLFDSGIIKLDTDFRTFTSDAGDLDGVDIAYVLDGYFYHTSLDDLAHLWPGALQMLGENVVGLLPAFGDAMAREGTRIEAASAGPKGAGRGAGSSASKNSDGSPRNAARSYVGGTATDVSGATKTGSEEASSADPGPAHRHFNIVKRSMPDPATVAARKAAMPVYWDYLGAIMFKYSMATARVLHTLPLLLMLALPLLARFLLQLLRRARPGYMAHRFASPLMHAGSNASGGLLPVAAVAKERGKGGDGPMGATSRDKENITRDAAASSNISGLFPAYAAPSSSSPAPYCLWDAMAASITPRRLAASLLSAVTSLLLAAVTAALVALLRTLVFGQPMRWYPRPWLAWGVYGAGALLGFTLERMLTRALGRRRGSPSSARSSGGDGAVAPAPAGSPLGPATPISHPPATPISPSWSSSSSSLISEAPARGGAVRARQVASRAATATGHDAAVAPRGRDAGVADNTGGSHAHDGSELVGGGWVEGDSQGGHFLVWDVELATAVWGRGLLHALLAAGMTLGGLKGPYFFVAWALAAASFAAMQWASLILPAVLGGRDGFAGVDGGAAGIKGKQSPPREAERGADARAGNVTGGGGSYPCRISLNAALLGQGRTQLAARVLALSFIPVSMCASLCFVLVQFLIEKSAMLGVLGTVGPDVVVAVLVGAASWLFLGTLGIPALSCGGASLSPPTRSTPPDGDASGSKSHHVMGAPHVTTPSRSRAPLVASLLIVFMLVSSFMSARWATFTPSHPKRVILQHTYVHGPGPDAARQARLKEQSRSRDGGGMGVRPAYEPHGPAMTSFWAVKSSDPGPLPGGIGAALRGLNRPRPVRDDADVTTWFSDEPGEDTVVRHDKTDMFLGIYPAGLNMHAAVTLVPSSLGVSSDRYIPRVEISRRAQAVPLGGGGSGTDDAVRVTVTIDTLVPAWITTNISGEGLLRWAPNGNDGPESPAPTGVELPTTPAGAPMYPLRHVSTKTRWSFHVVRRGGVEGGLTGGQPLQLKLAVLYPQPSVEVRSAKQLFPPWADVMAFTVYLSEWDL
eukprot:jgi/Mesvir1/10739/Mv13811-RA.1